LEQKWPVERVSGKSSEYQQKKLKSLGKSRQSSRTRCGSLCVGPFIDVMMKEVRGKGSTALVSELMKRGLEQMWRKVEGMTGTCGTCVVKLSSACTFGLMF